MLLAISNDLSLRTLKNAPSEIVAEMTYAAFLLTEVHGIAYQMIEKRHVPWVLLFATVMIAVAVA
jgi:hypothetical protein